MVKINITFITPNNTLNRASVSDKIRILYVDDELNNLTSFKAAFRREFEVITASSGPEALDILKDRDIEVIVSDQRMPEMTGVEFLQKVKELEPAPIRILLTGYADINAVIDAINKGEVYRYVQKPWDETDLRLTLQHAFEVYELREENKNLTEKLKKVNKQLEFLLRQNLIS